MPQWIRRVVLASAAIFSVLAAQAREVRAQDSGWFDPSTTPQSAQAAAPSAPSAPAAPPGAASQPQPGDGTELPSLPPSPLLSDRNAEPPASDPADADPRALTDFAPKLDPYGSWMDHPMYGRVWVPSRSVVGTGFAPYVSSGRWALDDESNWVWISDYPFGEVVFHYGRWVWVSNTGWAWIPGYRYAPAWVHWRVPTAGYAYVGWAPMGPDYVWFHGYPVSFWYGVSTPWVFCPSAYVFHTRVHHYVVHDRGLVTRLAANTRRYVAASPRQARRFSNGPPVSVARVPERAVPAERIRSVPRFRPPERAASRAIAPASAARLAPLPRTRSQQALPASPGAPSAVWGERRAPAPVRERAAPGAPERMRPAPAAPERARPAPVEPRVRSLPATEPRMRPMTPRSEPRMRDLAPRQRAPIRDMPSGGPSPRLHRARP